MKLAEASFRAKSRTVRRASGAYLDELIANERLPRERILLLQAERAAAIARFAASHTAFYARTYEEHGIDLARLEDPEQWQRIPIIDRAVVKEHASQLRSSEANDKTARSAKTGGSTGEPLRTLHDNRTPNLALAWRMYRWWGVQPWDNLARVGRWGFGFADTVKNTISWWPSTQFYLDATLFSPDTMREFQQRIVRHRPALIEGYVGAMVELANFLDAEGLRIPAPRAIATTAAPLTDNVRHRLESVFGAPVYDEYRGSEVNWLAGECGERNGLHMFADARRIEIIGDDGRPAPAGTVGDVVITDLTNRVFPLIRYRPGDRAALTDAQCACGRGLPLMKQPEGRTTDVIRLPSGAMINHGLMAMFADHPEAVRLFQIHQAADHSLHIRIVRGVTDQAEAHIEEAVDKVRRRIDDEVPVTVEYVESLPYTGGKTKYLISDVAVPE